jgi:endo-1,4-beta-xylanase
MRYRRFSIALLLCAIAGGESLRELADKRGVKIGAAAVPARLGEPDYARVLSTEFNLVEPENALKFGPVHPAPDRYNFAPVDALMLFAKKHNMAVRGHTLVWHRQNPPWVTNGNHTPQQLSAILREHIRTVAGRYAGRIYAWDVVNEAFNDDGSIRGTIWSEKPGIGLPGLAYIEQALRWAREADPKARLFYNDYSAEGMNPKSDAIYRMAADFKKRGVPLDGVGLQMHFTLDPPPLTAMQANIQRLTDLGLDVEITELDVRLPMPAGAPTAEALAAQTRIYGDIVALCLKNPRCKTIQTWGFTDKYSWIPRSFPGTGSALIFDASYAPKGAHDAIKQAFAAR